MKASRLSGQNRPVHLFAVACIGMLLIASLLTLPERSPAQERAVPVDLAAIAITGSDIESVPRLSRGAGDYRVAYSETLFPDAYIAHAALLKEIPEAAIRDQIEAAGMVRAHYTYLESAVVGEGDANRTVSSYAIEYEDAGGAADAWQVIQDESGLAHATDIEGLGEFGNASEGTLEVGVLPDTGDPYAQLDTTVLLGRFHLGVAIVDWNGNLPAIGYAHLLTRILLARADTVIALADPGLSTQVLRVTGDSVSTYADAYAWLDGEARLIHGRTWTEADVEAWAGNAGITAEYYLWQQLIPENAGHNPDVDLYVTVTRFVDDAAAAAWIEDDLELTMDVGTFSDVEQIDIPGDGFGDNAYIYSATNRERGTTYLNLTFQHGDAAVRIAIESIGPAAPPAAGLVGLGALQQACLEAEQCVDPVEVPAPLAEFIEQLQ